MPVPNKENPSTAALAKSLAQLLQAGGPETGADLFLLDGIDVLLPVGAGPLIHGRLWHVGGGKHDGAAGGCLLLLLLLLPVLRLLRVVGAVVAAVVVVVGGGQAVDALAVEQDGAAVGAHGGGGVLGEHGPAEAVVGDKVLGLGAVDAGVGGRGHGGRLAAELHGVVGDGLDSRRAVGKVQRRDGQPVHHDGEEHQKVYRRHQRLDQVVADHVARGADVREEVLRVLDVEDGADSDGAELWGLLVGAKREREREKKNLHNP